MAHIGQYDEPVTCAFWLQDEEDDPFSTIATSNLRPAFDDVTPHDPGGTETADQQKLRASLASDPTTFTFCPFPRKQTVESMDLPRPLLPSSPTMSTGNNKPAAPWPDCMLSLHCHPFDKLTSHRIKALGHEPVLNLSCHPERSVTSLLWHIEDKWSPIVGEQGMPFGITVLPIGPHNAGFATLNLDDEELTNDTKVGHLLGPGYDSEPLKLWYTFLPIRPSMLGDTSSASDPQPPADAPRHPFTLSRVSTVTAEQQQPPANADQQGAVPRSRTPSVHSNDSTQRPNVHAAPAPPVHTAPAPPMQAPPAHAAPAPPVQAPPAHAAPAPPVHAAPAPPVHAAAIPVAPPPPDSPVLELPLDDGPSSPDLAPLDALDFDAPLAELPPLDDIPPPAAPAPPAPAPAPPAPSAAAPMAPVAAPPAPVTKRPSTKISGNREWMLAAGFGDTLQQRASQATQLLQQQQQQRKQRNSTSTTSSKHKAGDDKGIPPKAPKRPASAVATQSSPGDHGPHVATEEQRPQKRAKTAAAVPTAPPSAAAPPTTQQAPQPQPQPPPQLPSTVEPASLLVDAQATKPALKQKNDGTIDQEDVEAVLSHMHLPLEVATERMDLSKGRVRMVLARLGIRRWPSKWLLKGVEEMLQLHCKGRTVEQHSIRQAIDVPKFMDPNGPAVGTHLVVGAANTLFERYKDCPHEFARGREQFKNKRKQREALAQQPQQQAQQQAPPVPLQCAPVAPTMPVMAPPQHMMVYMPHHLPPQPIMPPPSMHQHNVPPTHHVPLPPPLDLSDDGFDWLLEGLDDLTADMPADVWGGEWASQPALEVGLDTAAPPAKATKRGRSKKVA